MSKRLPLWFGNEVVETRVQSTSHQHQQQPHHHHHQLSCEKGLSSSNSHSYTHSKSPTFIPRRLQGGGGGRTGAAAGASSSSGGGGGGRNALAISGSSDFVLCDSTKSAGSCGLGVGVSGSSSKCSPCSPAAAQQRQLVFRSSQPGSSVSWSINGDHLPLVHQGHFVEKEINWNIQSIPDHSSPDHKSSSPLTSSSPGPDGRVNLIAHQSLRPEPRISKLSTSNKVTTNSNSNSSSNNNNNHNHNKSNSNSDSTHHRSVHPSISSSTQLIVQPPTNRVPVSVEIHTSPHSTTKFNPHPPCAHHSRHRHWSLSRRSGFNPHKKLRIGYSDVNVTSSNREMTVFTIYKPDSSTSQQSSTSLTCHPSHPPPPPHHHQPAVSPRRSHEQSYLHLITSATASKNASLIKETNGNYHSNLPHATSSSSPSVFHSSSQRQHHLTPHPIESGSGSTNCNSNSNNNQLSLPSSWNNKELTASNCNLETIVEETANLSPVNKDFTIEIPSSVNMSSSNVYHSSSWNSLNGSITTDSIVATRNTKITGKSFSHNTLLGGAGGGSEGEDDLPSSSTELKLPIALLASSSNNSINNVNCTTSTTTIATITHPTSSNGNSNNNITTITTATTTATTTPATTSNTNTSNSNNNNQRNRRKSSILSVDKLFKNKIIATSTNAARTSITSRLSIASDQDLRVTNFNRLTDLRKMLNEEDEKDDLITIFWHKFQTCDWFEWNLNNAAKLITIGVFVVTVILITRAIINLNK